MRKADPPQVRSPAERISSLGRRAGGRGPGPDLTRGADLRVAPVGPEGGGPVPALSAVQTSGEGKAGEWRAGEGRAGERIPGKGRSGERRSGGGRAGGRIPATPPPGERGSVGRGTGVRRRVSRGSGERIRGWGVELRARGCG